jgi:hypothetical protein
MVRILDANEVSFDYGPPPLIKAFIVFSGDNLNLSHITERLMLQPTEMGVKGEARPGRRPPVPETFWLFTVEKNCFAIDEALANLLNNLWDRRQAVRDTGKLPGYSADFRVNITIYENRPEYCLLPDTLTKLAFFGFELCLDIFDYSET